MLVFAGAYAYGADMHSHMHCTVCSGRRNLSEIRCLLVSVSMLEVGMLAGSGAQRVLRLQSSVTHGIKAVC